ncbi:CPBP family intramembrane glutamic endopeptidase [Lentiprolixibacter aurantiacus]|uniref:Type II CAAX endopeptidase family protein n=1 Tax=Lentiprolixibacter aurantiacus TaxID=2993939 RepID=A0AAE3SPE4_9FLAO|nr:type II CAAX endopeptidase family protein [Lentiprolixibacter aurantiacus]MCX2719447.1 type II CAAX endopeptidase family protein [Lentiprolixibacter aurantiacus]
MYIEQGYKGYHEPWRYVVGFLAVFIGWQLIGALPLTAAVVIKSLGSGSFPTSIGGMADLLGANLFLFLMLISFLIAFVFLLLVVKFLHRQPLRALTTERSKIDWKRVFFAFGLWAVVSVFFMLLDVYLSPDDYVQNFELRPFLILLVIAVVLIPVQTSFEEYFMRGYLMQGIGLMTKKRWIALLGTSFLFGILHIFNPEVDKLGYGIMVFYIGTGLFLGILTLMDKGLELAIGFHAANNLLAALLVTAEWTAFQTPSVYKDVSDPELGWDVFIPVLVVYPIMLLVFRKRYGWTNWKDRLTGAVLPQSEIESATDE